MVKDMLLWMFSASSLPICLRRESRHFRGPPRCGERSGGPRAGSQPCEVPRGCAQLRLLAIDDSWLLFVINICYVLKGFG